MAALTFLVPELDSEMIQILQRNIFALSASVFVGVSAAHAATIQDIDINGDGFITEAEFAEFFKRGNHRVPKRIAKAAMEKYDLDGSGVVTANEIIAVSNGGGRDASKGSTQAGRTPGANEASSVGSSNSGGKGNSGNSGSNGYSGGNAGGNSGGNSGNNGGGNSNSGGNGKSGGKNK